MRIFDISNRISDEEHIGIYIKGDFLARIFGNTSKSYEVLYVC